MKGIVQIVHGMAEHAGRYAAVAAALVEARYVVYAHDLRGHGLTAHEADDLGLFAEHDGWSHALDDIHRIGELACRENPGAPRCLLGHSMGSLLAQSYLLDHASSLDALVLSATTVGGGPLVHAGRALARLERWRSGVRGRSALLEFLSFGAYNKGFRPARTEADWLSRDPAQVDLYVNDPLCGFRSTNQLWVELLDAMARLGSARWDNVPKDLPIYVFSGALDPLSERTRGVLKLIRRYERAGLRRVTHRFYPDARHECFNELNRHEVYADLIAWLDANLARP